MRIAILQGAFLPIPTLLGGAVEKMWYALSKEFVDQGHVVTHISRSYPGLPENEYQNGITYIRVRGHDTPQAGLLLKWFDLLYTLRTRTLFNSDYDVIVTNTFWAPIILPTKARSRCLVDVQRMPKKQMKLYNNVARLRANSTAVTTAICSEIPKFRHSRVVTIPNPLPFTNQELVDFTQKSYRSLYRQNSP